MMIAAGCAPVITHGPEVRSGFSGGVSAVIGNGPTYENGDDPGPFYFGSALLSAAYGLRPSRTTLPAIRLGIQAPTTGGLASDVFIQAPQAWLGPVAGGVGLLAEISNGRTMPYVQAGIRNSEGFGLNVAIGRYSNNDTHAGYDLNERAQINWLSLQAPFSQWVTGHLHLGAAFGHVRKQFTRSSAPYVDEDRWVKLGGATIEFHRPRPPR